MAQGSSSKSWLRRQENDPYVLKARKMGYRSRAFFKIEEIDLKFSLFKKQMNVFDIGAAPGGWSQYAAMKFGLKQSKIFAVDLLSMQEIPGVDFIQGDVNTLNIDEITEKYPLQIIMSDMAPNSCGHKATDHLKMLSLSENVIDLANTYLQKNGNLVLKIWQGEGDYEMIKDMKSNFEKVFKFKPKSSRKESREMYLIGMNKK